MRGWLSLPVLDSVTGEIIGVMSPRQGLVTNMGVILRHEGGSDFTFRDENGVLVRHPNAKPWVREEEARRFGFGDSPSLMPMPVAVAV